MSELLSILRQFPCTALCQLNAEDEDPLSQGIMSALTEAWEDQVWIIIFTYLFIIYFTSRIRIVL